VDLYDNAYAHYDAEVYRQIRVETYGEDLGQTSWVTTEESDEIPRTLGLTPTSYALEIGCGSGRYAMQVAATVGCRILGVDINGPGINNANQLAAARNMSAQVRFEICDASKKLSFGDSTFDAVFSNDSLCHVPERSTVLGELFRVLKPGGGFCSATLSSLAERFRIRKLQLAARSASTYSVLQGRMNESSSSKVFTW